MLTIVEAAKDHGLFARWFRDLATWEAWFAFLSALFALPLDDRASGIYQQCTARTAPPASPPEEAWLVVGRRGGKSFIVALIAVYLACFRDYREYLSPGEHGTVMITASDRKQARVIFRYVRALLEEVPMLARMIERSDSQSIDLNNCVTIEIHTASYRAVRGYTLVAAINDEIAFWRSDDSANPDREILDAQRPAMATIPGAMLLCIGNPYARRGALWDTYRDHYGRDDSPILVWQADTRTMNPTIPASVVDADYARDPASAAAEYGAQFRTDVAAFLNPDWIDAAVDAGVFERNPIEYVNYFAFAELAIKSRRLARLADVVRGHLPGPIALNRLISALRSPSSIC